MTIATSGNWVVERWDTLGGGSTPVARTVVKGLTPWTWAGPAAAHQLVRMYPRTSPQIQALQTATAWTVVSALTGPAAVQVDEPNVLLLVRVL